MLLMFDQIEMMIEQMGKLGNDGYPPYNIAQTSSDRLCITIAVAGFAKNELTITFDARELSICGKHKNKDDKGRIYLHRGIANRQFARSFILAENSEITGAVLKNGLLYIELLRKQSAKTIKKIAITLS